YHRSDSRMNYLTVARTVMSTFASGRTTTVPDVRIPLSSKLRNVSYALPTLTIALKSNIRRRQGGRGFKWRATRN
ncbi:hypothetical protein, partial [Mesorhizobium sp. M7A.F.Ca.CA.003.01.2.1]|uniref:hypothetical protein n=1 Tax=Mesorhizobium sp. M7A.F.Ca.CA.003.01.2.1 TaxID=2496722 RepID=UPI0019CF8568